MFVIFGVVLAGGAEAFTGSLIAHNTTGVALGLIFGVGVWLIITGAQRGAHHPTRRAARGGAPPVGSDLGAGHPRPTLATRGLHS